MRSDEKKARENTLPYLVWPVKHLLLWSLGEKELSSSLKYVEINTTRGYINYVAISAGSKVAREAIPLKKKPDRG